MIKIITGFDGACPHTDAGVKRLRGGQWVFYPGTRREPGLGEEIPGKGSRFSTRLLNTGKTPEAVTLIVDWDTPDRTEHHDLGFIRHEADQEWTMIPGRREGVRVEYDLLLAPGLTHLGLFPEYNVEQLAGFVRELRAQGVTVEIAGRSRERRPIWMISFKSPNPKAMPFFIQARDHAYETAGSYSAEGVARFLATDDPMARYLREKFSVYIMPMTNPDGVYNGMSQRTWERGPRMDQVFDIPDSALKTVKRVVDRIKPGMYLTFHNWTLKFTDGILYGRHQDVAESFQRLMPADFERHKHWDMRPLGYMTLKKMGVTDLAAYVRRGGKPASADAMDQATNTLSARISHWIIYCEEIHNSIGMALEFPWFGLNTAEMRDKGRRAFIAAALAVVETRKL
ncbi:MAG: M14 family zinc carboxypeptidase [Kiritimatiellia bacterium]|jgi:hypothetical protein